MTNSIPTKTNKQTPQPRNMKGRILPHHSYLNRNEKQALRAKRTAMRQEGQSRKKLEKGRVQCY